MEYRDINNQRIFYKQFDITLLDKLIDYLQKLSPESKGRFGPHPFTKEGIIEKYQDEENYKLFIAAFKDEEVIAYAIIKRGWINFDEQRLLSYGLSPQFSDCTLAPSVADDWQSKGVGSVFLEYIIDHLKSIEHIKRIILWGGVQSTNKKAIGYYKKFGFKKLGDFEHNGNNFDMMLEL